MKGIIVAAEESADALIDRPTTDDLLKFKRFANPVADIISGVADDSIQLTIGVYGEWGSGKTSFLRMVAARLREKEIYPVWFDAWKYEKEDNLWSALLQIILNQASKHGRWYRRIWVKFKIWTYTLSLSKGLWEVAQKLWSFILRLLLVVASLYIILGLGGKEIQEFFNRWFPNNPILPTSVQPIVVKTIVAFIGVAAADPFKVIDLLKGNLSIDFSKFERKASYRDHIAFLDDFSAEFQKIIQLLMSRNPLVVIIDDLDRCLPERTLLVLEAIKAFLDIQGCVFLLGLDRDIVEKAVTVKYKELSAIGTDKEDTKQEQSFSRRQVFPEDYVDKIIQLSIVVPRLSETQISDFIGHLNRSNKKEDKDIEQCANIFGVGLPPNPRKIKRILRAFRFVRDVVNEGIREGSIQAIKVSLLAKLIVIQNQLPSVYEILPEQPSLLGELEKYYRKRIASQALPDANKEILTDDPILRDRAENYAKKYPVLPRVLLEKIDAEDTFIAAPLHLYISLIGTLAEVRPPLVKPVVKLVEKGILPSTQSRSMRTGLTALPRLWNIPYQRNRFFTDREDILGLLRDRLAPERVQASTQPVALCGLGGIGKTQIALEYAYRYQDMYQAIFWARADSYQTLVSEFITIASLLNLPEKGLQDQTLIVSAVKHWLNSDTGWLFVFDSVEDLEIISHFLPSRSRGHILLTTRTQITEPLAQRIPLETIGVEEAALFLLRRAHVIASQSLLSDASKADRAAAMEIARRLGGLPLALDQAGAYMEETQCGLAAFLEIYQEHHSTLLKRRGGLAFDYPEAVVSTWSLAFKKIEQKNPAAAELLRLCAFFAPDAIPEEIVTESASELGQPLKITVTDPLLWDAAIAELIKYSLVRRNSNQTLTIHRLVQAVLKDEMNKQLQQQLAERVVHAVNRVFPRVEYATWSKCERYLPQALVCADLIVEWDMAFPEAGRLLNEAGRYLYERAQYARAEGILEHAMQIRYKVLGANHPDVAQSLNNLALLYHGQGRYAQALPLYQRALTIREQALGSDHPDVAQSLDNLALLYRAQGKYTEAEPLYQKALAIYQKALGANHPDVAQSLNNLALLYHAQGRYAQALPLYQRALTIRQQALGSDHPDVAQSLNNLAGLYDALGKYAEAESLYKQALTIRENVLGPEHPAVATCLNNLAELYRVQGRYTEAEPFYQRALSIYEKVLGPGDPNVATCLNNLAGLYQTAERYEEAKHLYQRAIAIYEKILGQEDPNVAICLNNLATVYREQGNYAQAESLYERALSIYEHIFGVEDLKVAASLNNLAGLYQVQGKYAKAEPLYQRALSVYEQILGSKDLSVARVLESYATMLRKAKRNEEALLLEERIKEIQASYNQETP